MTSNTNLKARDVDRGWAWVSLVACLLSTIIVSFASYSAGIFHIALLRKYEKSNAETAIVGSINSSLLCLLGPLAGMFINATSLRTTTIFGGVLLTLGFALSFFANTLNVTLITYGIIAGTGSAFCVVQPPVLVSYNFDKYKGIATGIVYAGGGLGMLIGGPLVQTLLDKYGLHGSFLFMGGLTSQIIVCGAVMRPSTTEILNCKERNSENIGKSKSEKCKEIFEISIFKNKSFVLVLVATVLLYSASAIVLLHLPNFAVVQGSSPVDASLLLLELGVGNVFSRFVMGLMVGKEGGIDPFILGFGGLAITGVVTILFPLFSTLFWQQSLFAVLFGVYAGSLITCTVYMCLETVGISKMAIANGFVFFATGIGYVTGPTLAGFIIDQTGTYEYCFYYAGTCLILSSLTILLSTMWRPKDVERGENMMSNFISGSGFLPGSRIIFRHTQSRLSSINHLDLHTDKENVKQKHIIAERVPLRTSDT